MPSKVLEKCISTYTRKPWGEKLVFGGIHIAPWYLRVVKKYLVEVVPRDRTQKRVRGLLKKMFVNYLGSKLRQNPPKNVKMHQKNEKKGKKDHQYVHASPHEEHPSQLSCSNSRQSECKNTKGECYIYFRNQLVPGAYFEVYMTRW